MNTLPATQSESTPVQAGGGSDTGDTPRYGNAGQRDAAGRDLSHSGGAVDKAVRPGLHHPQLLSPASFSSITRDVPADAVAALPVSHGIDTPDRAGGDSSPTYAARSFPLIATGDYLGDESGHWTERDVAHHWWMIVGLGIGGGVAWVLAMVI